MIDIAYHSTKIYKFIFIKVWLVLFVMMPTMVLIMTSFPGIRRKILSIKNTQSNLKNNVDDDDKIISIGQLCDGALSVAANITGHSSLTKPFLLLLLYFSIMIF